jgi:hypothetical protein
VNTKTHTAINIPKALRDRLRTRTSKGEPYSSAIVRALDLEDAVDAGALGPVRCEECKGVAKYALQTFRELVDHIRKAHPALIRK